ncbi:MULTISPECIES: Vps62-related protein [Pseudomonas syringae group]|uniref:Vps62-related protein n=1 Tax=Pseudomonas syringae group TaxID=136849 RepID=UPI000F0365E0|nr:MULTISPECIES: Vps62-related protein [Pseudomonas syringae group]MBS7422608.1 Vps62-related protein [Pseudomonas syringae]MBS7434362.1 Vps62-related protein [Pseudomonas syringae]QVI80450.1 Vps62-related protein [Pseudomonas syringae]
MKVAPEAASGSALTDPTTRRVVIGSTAFPNVYLRLDGSGVNKFSGPGGGIANCQYYAAPYETFNLISNSDGTVSFASTVFSNVFLRLDGAGVTQPSGTGGGVANGQYTAGPYEKFQLVPNDDGSQSIASTAFPNVYLRLDGQGVVKPTDSGGGTVNAAYGIGPWEKFKIADFSVGLTQAELTLAIQTYGPILRFHPNEQYKMCSVEAFLQHAKLHDSKTGQDINHPAVSQLPSGAANDGRYWLVLEDAFKGGDPSTSKAYVHAYWKPGMTYTDLQFWFFYAYNGPGTAHINGLAFDTIAHSGDPTLAPLGEHYGDWECCMIRIDNQEKTLIGAWLSQHSGGQMFGLTELNQFQLTNQQINVYSSLNGHAVYAEAGSNYSEHRKYPDPGVPVGVEFFLRNDTQTGGGNLDCSQKYEIVSADWLGVSEPQWLNYPYRWGPEGAVTHLSPKAVTNILYAALGWLSYAVTPRIMAVLAGFILAIFVKDDVNGPEGPKTKSTWTGNY